MSSLHSSGKLYFIITSFCNIASLWHNSANVGHWPLSYFIQWLLIRDVESLEERSFSDLLLKNQNLLQQGSERAGKKGVDVEGLKGHQITATENRNDLERPQKSQVGSRGQFSLHFQTLFLQENNKNKTIAWAPRQPRALGYSSSPPFPRWARAIACLTRRF